MFLSEYFQHRRDCARKQSERASKISNLPSSYKTPISVQENDIFKQPILELVQNVQNGVQSPIDILHAYGKAAIKAHNKTNCVTEILFPEAEEWIENQINLKGPLAGIPVSLKDSIHVAGFDTSVGYSCNVGKPQLVDGPIVKMLKDAGAVPFVKTNLPTTLLSFESTNDVWGRTMNPHNTGYSAGGSTGGEGAILAAGGSRIGIGSDVAGSVRAPAHFSGCYSLRCSTGRWPKMGNNTSMPGQEGIPSVFSPMARTLDDLRYFTQAFIGMKPWTYDHSVHPIPWRDDVTKDFSSRKSLRIGVLRTDGVVNPSPACSRGLQMAVDALTAAGHTVFDISPPSTATPTEGLILASRLLNNDGCRVFHSFFRPGESNDPGAKEMLRYAKLPTPFRYLHYLWVRYVRRDPLWAELLWGFRQSTTPQLWALVARRESYRYEWLEWWNEMEKQGGLDVLLTPPNATPAVPHDGMKEAVSSCGYTFLFNLLDYSAGIVPVTRVDAKKDVLPAGFSTKGLNGVAKGAYKLYDAQAMEGLPVTVQVVGRRLEEEKVLAIMQRLEDALDSKGEKYRLLELDELD